MNELESRRCSELDGQNQSSVTEMQNVQGSRNGSRNFSDLSIEPLHFQHVAAVAIDDSNQDAEDLETCVRMVATEKQNKQNSRNGNRNWSDLLIEPLRFQHAASLTIQIRMQIAEDVETALRSPKDLCNRPATD